MALFNYLCVFCISLTVQRWTPLEIWQKFSDIAIYMHRFRIVSSVNSWVARLLCLPPMFHFVWLGVQRENHCDCASSSHGQAPQWRKPKTDCHNKRKLVSDPMTMLNDGPFITLAEVFTTWTRMSPNTNRGLIASFPSLKLLWLSKSFKARISDCLVSANTTAFGHRDVG